MEGANQNCKRLKQSIAVCHRSLKRRKELVEGEKEVGRRLGMCTVTESIGFKLEVGGSCILSQIGLNENQKRAIRFSKKS